MQMIRDVEQNLGEAGLAECLEVFLGNAGVRSKTTDPPIHVSEASDAKGLQVPLR